MACMQSARGPMTSVDRWCETGLCTGQRSGPDVQLSWLTPAEATHHVWVQQMPLACDDANNCPYHPTLLWGVKTNIVGISLV